MPLREIEERFTLSEVAMQAWRSQEQGHQMRQRTKQAQQQNVGKAQRKPSDADNPLVVGHDARLERIRQITEATETVFEDKSGNFTLKHGKDKEVLAILGAMGMSGFGRGH